jgi:hypothetical protein
MKLIRVGNGIHSDTEPNFNIQEIKGRKALKMLFTWSSRTSCASPEYWQENFYFQEKT